MEIEKRNGKRGVVIREDKYGIEVLTMRNGYQWSGMPMDAELIDMLEQAIVEFKNTQSSPASAPEVTDGMVYAFHHALTDHSIGQEELDEIKTGLRAALAAAPTPPVSEDRWQPIATAPKNEFVLLAWPSGYTTIETVFATGRMCSDYHVGRWIDHANDDLTDWGFEPTHWMPLPKAPTMQEDKP